VAEQRGDVAGPGGAVKTVQGVDLTAAPRENVCVDDACCGQRSSSEWREVTSVPLAFTAA